MKNTDNYNLNIPEDTDQYNEEHYNENFETIDTELQNMIDTIERLGGTV